MSEKTYGKDFKLYRAKKDGSGCAMSLKYDPKNDAVWLSGAKQDGEVFDWKSNIVMKLGLSDIGELIAVLERRKSFAGQEGGKYQSLFHKAESHTSSLKFLMNDNLTVSMQMRVNKENNNVQHSLVLTQAESSILLVLLKDVVSKIFSW